MRIGSAFSAVALAVALGCAGCSGTISDPGAPDPGNGNPGGGNNPGGNNPGGKNNPGGNTNPGGGTTPADPNAAGPMPLRRMTRAEFNNTVRDLLGDTSNPANAFPLDRDPEFLYPRAGLASLQDVDTLKDAALALGKAAEAKATTLAPCPTGMAEDACARSFITSFGLRAYRRPLATEELDRLTALYTTGRTTLALNYAATIGLLVEGIIQAPQFLYHWELGNNAPAVEGKLVRLTPYETASRLSYFIYNSMPDQALFDAAAMGKLGTPAELEAQARRMLADAKGAATVGTFVDEWLNLDTVADRPKDPAVYPEFNDDLKTAMTAETKALVGAVMAGDKKLSTLLTGTSTSVNQSLAAVYGLTGVRGTTATAATLNASQRSGLLTRAAFLTVAAATDGSHPSKRGRRVYERFLCGVLPPPPNTVPPVATAASSMGKTTRQRFEDHDGNPCSTACHSIMDPIGFLFENYDGLGKYRTMDNGGVVDSHSEVKLDGSVQPFANALELSKALAASPEVAACFATQWFRFGFKRAETDQDAASVGAVAASFKGSNSIVDAMVGVAMSRSFRYRTPAAGEMLQ